MQIALQSTDSAVRTLSSGQHPKFGFQTKCDQRIRSIRSSHGQIMGSHNRTVLIGVFVFFKKVDIIRCIATWKFSRASNDRTRRSANFLNLTGGLFEKREAC